MVFDMFYDYKHQHRSVILTKVAEKPGTHSAKEKIQQKEWEEDLDKRKRRVSNIGKFS